LIQIFKHNIFYYKAKGDFIFNQYYYFINSSITNHERVNEEFTVYTMLNRDFILGEHKSIYEIYIIHVQF